MQVSWNRLFPYFRQNQKTERKFPFFAAFLLLGEFSFGFNKDNYKWTFFLVDF